MSKKWLIIIGVVVVLFLIIGCEKNIGDSDISSIEGEVILENEDYNNVYVILSQEGRSIIDADLDEQNKFYFEDVPNGGYSVFIIYLDGLFIYGGPKRLENGSFDWVSIDDINVLDNKKIILEPFFIYSSSYGHFIADELRIEFKEQITEGQISALENKYNLSLSQVNTLSYEAKLNSRKTIFEIREELLKEENIEFVSLGLFLTEE